MASHAPEDIVRRATAAFNAGRRDEARALCEQGLIGSPGEPMMSHLLAAVLFASGETEAARAHVETSLANGLTMRPRGCLPRVSPERPGISTALCRIWIV